MVKSVIKTTILLLMVFSAGVAANPIGYGFSVYADPAGTDGQINDNFTGILSLYVVPFGPPEVSAVQFSAQAPACFQGVYLQDYTPFPIIIGNSQYDVSIAYGTCMTWQSFSWILRIDYFVQGLTTDCCWYPLDMGADDPNGIPGHITFTDCSDPPVLGNFRAGSSVINWVQGCDSPVESSTWGQVKSLYKP